jgi:hypothetical protein
VRTGRLDRVRSLVDRRDPEWVEARSIVHASGSFIPPLLISDNNIGLVSIERSMGKISHKLLVRKRSDLTKIHESIVLTKDGKSALEDSVKARISRYAKE